MDKPLAKRWRN